MVQAVSGFRKEPVNGSVSCATRRASQADVNSGWQLDFADPLPDRVRRFSEGRRLSVEFEVYPCNGLEGRIEETGAEAVEQDRKRVEVAILQHQWESGRGEEANLSRGFAPRVAEALKKL